MAIDTHTEPPDVHPTPGVSYSPATGRAYVGDTGIQVFQIITTWHEVGHDRLALVTAYHWLTYDDLCAALAFYERNPAMVERRIEAERHVRVEDVWEEFPQSKPPYR